MSFDASAFVEEAEDLLEQAESALLVLENDTSDIDNINLLFRSIHTLKGNGAMFGFDHISKFAHSIETLLDQARANEVILTTTDISMFLDSRDILIEMLSSSYNVDEHPEVAEMEKNFLLRSQASQNKETQEKKNDKKTGIWHIILKVQQDVFHRGVEPVLIFDDLSELGELSVQVIDSELPSFESLDPTMCYFSWKLRLKGACSKEDVLDCFLFIEDEAEIDISFQSDVSPVVRAKKSRLPTQSANTIKVDSNRLDDLIDLVGQIVVNQAQLMQVASGIPVTQLRTTVDQMQDLTSELRDNVIEIRMLPIGNAFQRFYRLVRDLSTDLNKNIDLVTSGEDTELDKTMVEQIVDPLVHLIRNSIDHGIETPEERAISEKPERATISLSAHQYGDSVHIKISDDGRGLDTEKILKRALEKELIPENHQLSDDEINMLIFAPGFSTSDAITSLSGRGVGMDVVKQKIEDLKGHVELKSVRNQGTTVTLVLPMTLAIIDGLLVEVGDYQYIVPMSQAHECVSLSSFELASENEDKFITLREELIPLIFLDEFLKVPPNPSEERYLVISRFEEYVLGFVIDNMVGKRQVVIKSLGPHYSNSKIFSGATILGDGSMALIINTSEIYNQHRSVTFKTANVGG